MTRNEIKKLVLEYLDEIQAIEYEDLLYRMYVINDMNDDENRLLLDELYQQELLVKVMFEFPNQTSKIYYFPKGTVVKQ